VDPDNRVMARTLEREWEERLREHEQVLRDYERAKTQARVQLTEQDRARIRQLAGNLRAVWEAPTTQQADRKTMLGLVIEAISLQPVDVPVRGTRVRVQWKAGAVDALLVPRTPPGQHRKPRPEALARLRQLVGEGHQDAEVARMLDGEGYRSGSGQSWTAHKVKRTRYVERIARVAPDQRGGIRPPERLADASWSIAAAAQRYGVHRDTVRGWLAQGLVPVSRGRFGQNPAMQWLTIDEPTDERLQAMAARIARARSRV
jgi:hypothetical protein